MHQIDSKPLSALSMSTSTHMHTCTCTHTHTCTYTHTHKNTQIHAHTNHTEPTLTVDNLTTVLDSVQMNMYFVTRWLGIPRSQVDELQQQYKGQISRGYAEYFIINNVAPSWTTVANALWLNWETGSLKIVQVYLKGEPHMWPLMHM